MGFSLVQLPALGIRRGSGAFWRASLRFSPEGAEKQRPSREAVFSLPGMSHKYGFARVAGTQTKNI